MTKIDEKLVKYDQIWLTYVKIWWNSMKIYDFKSKNMILEWKNDCRGQKTCFYYDFGVKNGKLKKKWHPKSLRFGSSGNENDEKKNLKIKIVRNKSKNHKK